VLLDHTDIRLEIIDCLDYFFNFIGEMPNRMVFLVNEKIEAMQVKRISRFIGTPFLVLFFIS
jgi:hypothetical protein